MRLLILAMLPFLLVLAGCSATDLRDRADDLDKAVRETGRAADVLRDVASKGPGAIEALNGPIPQQVIAWLPPSAQAQIANALAIGADLPPVLVGIADELDAAKVVLADTAADLRAKADAGGSRFDATLGAIVAALTAAGGIAGAIGGIIGHLRGLKRGASEVVQIVNTGKAYDPDATAAFFGAGAGDAMRARMVEAPPVVREIIERNKI